MADTYNTGYPLSEGIADPPRMVAPVILSGRVRVAYAYVLATAATPPTTGDVVNVTTLPLGATILGVMKKWADMNNDDETLQLRAGTTAIGAADDVGTAQTAYAIDYTGCGVKITTEAMRTINVLLGGTADALDGTAGNKWEAIILYSLD